MYVEFLFNHLSLTASGHVWWCIISSDGFYFLNVTFNSFMQVVHLTYTPEYFLTICLDRLQTNQYTATMVLDSLSSPHRRSQNTFFVSSTKKPQPSRDDSWSALLERHRFLLTTLVVLAFLCTIYLYFAVTLGASDACAGLTGAERIECQAKSVLQHGKLKFL